MALGNIRYANDSFLSSHGPEPVFSEQQIRTLAPRIRQVLANIRKGQAVTFHQDKIRGDIFFNRGRLYWYFSYIENDHAFKLTDLAEEDARTSYAIDVIPEDDIDTSYWKLVPRPGQALYRGRPDMLVMPVSTLKPDTKRTTFLPKPGTHAQNHAAALSVDRDMAGRIRILHHLLDKDLITKDEYRQKLGMMIAEYETQHPSTEAGLEFLQMLNKKSLIPPDMLREQRQQVLDQL